MGEIRYLKFAGKLRNRRATSYIVGYMIGQLLLWFVFFVGLFHCARWILGKVGIL